MSLFSRATALSAFLIAFGCAAPPHEGGSYDRVSIGVQDVGGQPLAGATVVLNTGAELKVGTTDEDGTAQLEAVPAGDYCVRVQSDGFVDQFTKVTLQGTKVAIESTLRQIGMRQGIDPLIENVITDAGGGQVKIPADAFLGPIDSSSFIVEMTTMRPEDPGFEASHPGGRAVFDGSTMRSFGVLASAIFDHTGAPAQLRSGPALELSWPIPTEDPVAAVLTMFQLDVETGTWVPAGEAVRDESRGVYRADVSAAGIFSIGEIARP